MHTLHIAKDTIEMFRAALAGDWGEESWPNFRAFLAETWHTEHATLFPLAVMLTIVILLVQPLPEIAAAVLLIILAWKDLR